MPPSIGFVGLGAMGRPMAECLLREGLPTIVNDLDQAVVAELVDAGAESAGTLSDLARRVHIVGVCVPADSHVRAVLDGPDGLLENLDEGAVIAIHSTVQPETIEWADEQARRHDVGVVEAAITGGAVAAAEGRSTFLLRGKAEQIEALEPLLDACATNRVVVDGGLGDATRLKLCLNLQTYATFTGVSEAANLALELGLPIDGLRSAMAANGQLGELTETFMLAYDMDPADLRTPEAQESLERYAAIIDKDLELVSKLAAEAGTPADTAVLARRLARRTYFLEDDR